MSRDVPPKALLFDVFGTVVDWRTTVVNELVQAAEARLPADVPLSSQAGRAVSYQDPRNTTGFWQAFAQDWRNAYLKFTSSYDPASHQWIDVDTHHYQSLRTLLQHHDLEDLYSENEIKELSRVWHRLRAWDDVGAGLSLLNEHFVTATLSNGTVSLLADLAELNHLPWHHILSADHFRAYKPNPVVYNGAAEKLGLRPEECAMVAAHLGDLRAARGHGFQTIYMEREGEDCLDDEAISDAQGWVDMWIPGQSRSKDAVHGLVTAAKLFELGREGNK